MAEAERRFDLEHARSGATRVQRQRWIRGVALAQGITVLVAVLLGTLLLDVRARTLLLALVCVVAALALTFLATLPLTSNLPNLPHSRFGTADAAQPGHLGNTGRLLRIVVDTAPILFVCFIQMVDLATVLFFRVSMFRASSGAYFGLAAGLICLVVVRTLSSAWVRDQVQRGEYATATRALKLGLTASVNPGTSGTALLAANERLLASQVLQDRQIAYRPTAGPVSLQLAEASLAGIEDVHRDWLDLCDAAPHQPHGALGYADVRLANGLAAADACMHAIERSERSLSYGHLHPYAEANLVRSWAIEGRAGHARDLCTQVRQTADSLPVVTRAGVLHRLACALATLKDPAADALRDEAAALDPKGLVGDRALRNRPPVPIWP